MLLRQCTVATLPVLLTLWLLQTPGMGFAAETNATRTVPTGLYVSPSERPERITVDLKTNGAYTVLVTGWQTNSQSGNWTWDEAHRQFLLTPGTNQGAFGYELRVLRVDPRQEHTLQWIPHRDIGPIAGAVDYVRFKRKDD